MPQPRDLIIERLNAEKQSYSGFCLKGLVCGGGLSDSQLGIVKDCLQSLATSRD